MIRKRQLGCSGTNFLVCLCSRVEGEFEDSWRKFNSLASMDYLYMSRLILSCICLWSVAVLRTSDGSGITWHEPPPFHTVTSAGIASFTHKNLTQGFLDEELSCSFNLSGDMSLVSVWFELDSVTLASYFSSVSSPAVEDGFVSRFNATWVPTRLTLVVFNVTRDDKGEYYCKVQALLNGRGKFWNRKIQVDVLVQSQITNVSGETVSEGGNVTLKCLPEGNPLPSFTWTRLSDNSVVTMPLTNVRRQDAGEYRCIAVNGVGKPASKDAMLVVEYPVEASSSGENATVAKGVVKTFSCPVIGNPEPNITWRRGNESVGANNSYGKQLNVSKEGCYTCFASNSLGTPVNITQCLTFSTTDTTTPSTMSCSKKIAAKLLIIGVHLTEEYKDLNSSFSRGFMAEFEEEMDKIYKNMAVYVRTQVTNLSLGSEIDVFFTLCFNPTVTTETVVQILKDALNLNGTFGRYRAGRLALLEDDSTTSTTPGSPKPTVAADPPWVIIGAVAGGVVLLAILVGVLTWWVHKQRKCRKDTKIHNSDLGRHDDEGGCSQVQGAYAQSGPPAANGTDRAAEQEIEVAGAIPAYAVGDKSKRSKKQADEKPPEYAVVDKSKKKEKQEAAAIPTYAAVDKSKKKKKSREEVPPVYAEVDKSKKKKKKIDDKNLYETLDEPKKEKKLGELLYADLGDFQNPAMPTVCISPQPLPAIKKADPYERTDYADITQFLKGNATLPPNDGNGDTEMKPKRPSKKNIQGNDKETPI
ncbi:uncharacterized protein [Acropora muricata]|uniref:uncharacterized protein isoform X2 n=1 Tax=Acropora muricata TaxID=159855 RepID=UPI0034E4DBEB